MYKRQGDQIETANIVLVPGDGDGETAGELRIVLTWGEEPWDLDSHLACYSSDKPYHIWFGQTDFEGNSVGNLDVDDTSLSLIHILYDEIVELS